MWKNIVQRGRSELTIWRMHLVCCITKANTHSQSAIPTAFPLQKCLQECGSLLRYTYVACLVKYPIAQSTTVKDRTFCDASVTSPSHILMIATVSLHWISTFFRTEYSLWHSRNSTPFLLPNGPLLHSWQPAIGLYPEPDGPSPHSFSLLR
jgi:hypothetical protein